MEAFGTSRGFVDGRVDIVRSTSPASVAFVKAMVDPKIPVSDVFACSYYRVILLYFPQNDAKAVALAAAAKAHTEYAINVSIIAAIFPMT